MITLLLTYFFFHPALAINFNVVWDGENNPNELYIVTGDQVTWSSSIPPPPPPSLPVSFSVASDQFSPSFVDNNYVFTFNMQGEYHYIISSGDTTHNGVIKVKDAILFDATTFNYYLKLGDVVRWTWEGLEPTFPTSFNGFCPDPGFGNQGANHYDYAFMIPGRYSFWREMNEYVFMVEDPDTSPHVALDWNSYAAYHIDAYEGVFRFYNTDNRKHNVRIVRRDDMGMPDFNMVFWVSPDLLSKGDSIATGLAPGSYFGLSDYDPNITVTLNVFPYPRNEKDKGHGMIPKTAVYAFEISLFMLGVLGIGHFLKDTGGDFFTNEAKDMPVPESDLLNYAYDRSKERISTEQEETK